MDKRLIRFFKRKSVRKVLGTDYNLTLLQQQRLLAVLIDLRSVKRLEAWLPAMANFIKHDLTNYAGRLRRLQKLPAAPGLYSMVLRYGKAVGLSRHLAQSERKVRHFVNIEDNHVRNGCSPEAARALVVQVQRSRNAKSLLTLRGTSVYSVRSMQYWLRLGYPVAEARKKVAERQTHNGLGFYATKDAENAKAMQEERSARWFHAMASKPEQERRRIRLAKAHSIEGFEARGWPRDQAQVLSNAFFARRQNFSRLSQECFRMVVERIGSDGLFCKYLNHEKQFAGRTVDLFDGRSGTAIEFYGDYWHANPLVYKPDFLIHGKPAVLVRLDDRRRMALIACSPAVRQIHIVWESEFRADPVAVADDIAAAITMHRSEADERIR